MHTKSEETPLFLIGKDSRGNWVVQDKRGLRGGLFVNRAAALKFALFENGDRPELVITVPGVFELDEQKRLRGAAFGDPRRACSCAPARLSVGATVSMSGDDGNVIPLHFRGAGGQRDARSCGAGQSQHLSVHPAPSTASAAL
jgi:hypothetical protein